MVSCLKIIKFYIKIVRGFFALRIKNRYYVFIYVYTLFVYKMYESTYLKTI